MDEVSAARSWLRLNQRRFAQVHTEGGLDGHRVALARVDERERIGVHDGDDVHVEGFTFGASSEQARLDRTRAIIDRIEPGPHEDGIKLEILARQAATLELALLELDPHHDPDEGMRPIARALDRVILGTTGWQRHDAVTSKVGPASVITVSDGMMTAYYQSAKAVVLAWPLMTGDDGLEYLSTRLEVMAAGLDRDASPVLQLEETFGNWFYSGRPLPQRSAPPASEQRRRALTVVTACMERFVLAHEYVHAVFDQQAAPFPGDEPASAIEREVRADLVAAQLVMGSAITWDRFAPNMSLQGALLAVRIHEIVQEALTTAGRPEAAPSDTHPPLRDRIDMVVDLYREQVHREGDLDVRGMLYATLTLDELWRRARVPLRAWLTSDRPFHATWATT
ncbi:ImmA/IrrE family metallo-endopeptidase [Cellulomonas sp. PhB150]|uniref:ImmA/IrrE family metallo-endopeptidase n=1 Tax=Cellulomonas sp. PhB150 TaxID=2485188 RepID=UPI000F47CDFF|nr:hypothetical protein [Cellulomonas sp. PhB150]ROS27909.1 hypothetical protein EDF34_1702 [Cellulomonas sp. PhB150]